MLNRMKQVNPKAAEAFQKNPEELEKLLAEQSRQREILSNPNSLEAQKAIEEAIRQQNVMANMEAALESNPESFGHIDMLYLRFKVDGSDIDAFVDTGAQMTISKRMIVSGVCSVIYLYSSVAVVTYACAEKCGILRLLDTRYEGVAVGVGTGKICGKIHAVPVKLGSQHLPCPFTILESSTGPQVILGLDTLRRLHATIDLKRDALIVNEEVIPFLKGNEIPKESFGAVKE